VQFTDKTVFNTLISTHSFHENSSFVSLREMMLCTTYLYEADSLYNLRK